MTSKYAWRTAFMLKNSIHLELSRTDEISREHLPLVDPSPLECVTTEQFNTVIDFLAQAAETMPFGAPYYWQPHERHSYKRWLRSWKVDTTPIP